MRAKARVGECPCCNDPNVALRPDGRLAKHAQVMGTDRPRTVPCVGSGMWPKEGS